MAAPNILCDTAGMTNAQWLAARMHGPSGKIPYTVGGSDVAAVFGVSPWTTPLELWMIKKGRMKPPAKSNANQLEMGHLLEPIAAHWYAKKTGTSQLDMLDLGYASTIHKSQGSEYRSVIINLQCAHYVMLTRPLVYTAITRGKENVIIVGERRALCMAIKKTDTEKRGTCLAKRLQAAMQ